MEDVDDQVTEKIHKSLRRYITSNGADCVLVVQVQALCNGHGKNITNPKTVVIVKTPLLQLTVMIRWCKKHM